MKKIITLFFITILPLVALCQTNEKTANEAFVLVRMVNKFHVEPRELNNAFSADVFKGMLDKADPDHMFFIQNDIARLSIYKNKLDDEIRHHKTAYLDLFIRIYQQRLRQADSLSDLVSKRPFDFYSTEKLTATEDTLAPASPAAMQVKIYKKMKAWALDELTDEIDPHHR